MNSVSYYVIFSVGFGQDVGIHFYAVPWANTPSGRANEHLMK